MASLADTLDDMALLIMRIDESIQGRTYDDFSANSEAYDALTYRLAMLGETSKKLSEDIISAYPNLPWREMVTFRNFASHDYFGVDAKLVWQAAISLEPLKLMVLSESKRLSSK